MTGAIKVGRSDNPERRLHQLQTGCPYTLRIILVLPHGGHKERGVHRDLHRWRTRQVYGGEWFTEDGLGSIAPAIWEHVEPWYLENPDWWRADNQPKDAHKFEGAPMAFRKTGISITTPIVVQLPYDGADSDPKVVVTVPQAMERGTVNGDQVWDGDKWITKEQWYAENN